MGVKYLRDFEFPSAGGFHGSNKMPSNVGKATGAPRMASMPKVGKGQGYAEGGRVPGYDMDRLPAKKPPGRGMDLAPSKPFKGKYEGYADGGLSTVKAALARGKAASERGKAELAKTAALRQKMGVKPRGSGVKLPSENLVPGRGKPAMISPAAKRVEYIANETGQYDPSRGSGAGAVMMPSVEGQMQQVSTSPLKPYAKGGKAKGKKIAKVMREYKEGKLHSGSKKGPVVKNPKQAMAIALSEAGAKKKAEGGIFNDEYMAYESKGPKTRGTARKGREQGRKDRMERLALEKMRRAEKYAPGLSLDMADKKSKGGMPVHRRKPMYGGGKC